MRLAGVVLAALAALVLQYFVLIRPWYETWGATAAEALRDLPGDELIPDAADVETRGIAIRATPQALWPWIAQLGQERAGLYSYRWLENLLGAEMPSSTHLLGLPDPRPGDRFWIYPRNKARGLGYALYAVVDPGRALVLQGHGAEVPGLFGELWPGGTWAFVLEPQPDGTTRLLVRHRRGEQKGGSGPLASLYRALLFDPVQFAMERKLLLTVKVLAEGRPPPPAWADVAEVVLWLATAACGLAAAAAVLLRRATFWRPLAAGTVALFVLTLLFFARPPLLVAVVLVVGLRWVLAWGLKGEPGSVARPAS
ncbi:MAG TPA: hypothetical protein VMG32_06325 [Anaeromyxobacteraceae bacterium]|nr:hypothetical protein [Anaeromyxobacteraceae bacterium]